MVYKYPIIGGLTGLICAILFFTVGFFKTILVLLMVGVGSEENKPTDTN